MSISQSAYEIIQEVKKVLCGKDPVITKVMIAIIAGGNILMEDIPGVGKTTMAMAFAKAMDLDTRRMQFTADVMPSDVVGFSMFNVKTQEFEQRNGAVVCNLFLADEINRTSSKTQSALLEAMEEKQVTIDGKTVMLPEPFIVIATQNPIGSAGTQMLPESQVDRFMICISMGYPDVTSEMRLISARQDDNPLNTVRTVAGCYMMMFWDCTNLSNLTMLATEVSAGDDETKTSCTDMWLYNAGKNASTRTLTLAL